MDVLLPGSLAEALEMKAARPEALPISGGTDVMVELNFDRHRPEAIVDLTRVPELREHGPHDGRYFLGAGVTYARIMREMSSALALRQASRTVGSPQIRNRGTVGGNLGTASPAGDALTVLVAHDAEVVCVAAGGRDRALPWDAFLRGVKRTALAPDELILGTRWTPVRDPGSFSKVGTRNAMVISVARLCLQLDEETRGIRAFAEAVSAAASPIDDVRGSAAYRRHAVRVLAARALRWALAERRVPSGGPGGTS